jgi:hypothetical protein
MYKKEQAKQLLSHYMRLVFAESGLNFDSDNYAEIDLFVDLVVEAAKEEILQELEKYL